MKTRLLSLYYGLVLGKPLATLALVLLITGFFGWFVPDLRIDISPDSLVLEHDRALRYYYSIRARYGSDDYLIVTYTPKEGGLFEPDTLNDLRKLSDKLAAIKRVESVVSILDVPLVQSPPTSLEELEEHIRTLEDPDTNLALAERELRESPLYRNRLVSAGGNTTAMQVNFRRDPKYENLRKSRDALRAKELEAQLTPGEAKELERVTDEFRRYKAELMEQEEADIAQIRAILEQFQDRAELHLGGKPMVVADMVDFVRHDIKVFGIGVLGILGLLLIIAFRQPRWVILSMITALATSLVTMGFLGLAEWRLTVVSSNFLALLLIFVLSLSIHLIVRYRELHMLNPDEEQRYLVEEMVRSKFIPCLYMVLTTMVAFGSLVVSGIRPVIDFGWIMGISLTAALVLNFTLFPAALMLLKPGKPHKPRRDLTSSVISLFPSMIENHGNLVLGVAMLGVVLGVIGMFKLTVENRFIDNFHKSTEIYQGMYLMDRKLGGTIPLDVIIDAPAAFLKEEKEASGKQGDDSLAEGEKEPWGNEEPWGDADFKGEAGITGTSYWFNVFKVDEVNAIQNFLDGIPEIGKVLSLSTTLEVLKQINGGELPDNFALSLIYKRLPDKVKKELITPYLSPDGNQIRFDVRVYESDVNLKRQALLQQIRHHLTGEFGLSDDQVHLSGMLVLYNNMLQSLFRSQILTLGAVFLAIFLMFIVLFRSVKLALIAIVPSLVSVPMVLGLMGWLHIPLDFMTITIAGISIGIGVDDTIHYVHRFGEEVVADWDYQAAVRRSHTSIGRAMYYTTVTITIGFSILVLSKFVPTIYFGLLTALAMMIALAANFTVLPLLLERLKPYGKKPIQGEG
ncbi:MAG: MMPL family transporter [Deltaproteobacteria bacterium]|nr:MMPL family transporter [Deltaproteobacteria bacterium]